MDEAGIKQLIEKSFKAKEFAYNRYSNFRVGAAVMTKDGKIFTGCNVENASFSNTICAERTAIVKAVSEGHREFKAIAISSDLKDPISPCGSCRQVMLEFGLDYDVYLTRSDGTYIKMSPSELLPVSFRPDHLLDHQKSLTK